MTDKRKKALYESILKDVAKIVKKRLVEADYDSDMDLNEDGELVEWDDLSEITYEEFYNPALNMSFSNINDDFIFYDASTKQIGVKAQIEDKSGSDGVREFEIWADSFGKVLEYYDIALEASVQNLHEHFWKISTNKVIEKFWKTWRKALSALNDDKLEDALDDNVDDFYANVIVSAESIDDVVDGIANMQY